MSIADSGLLQATLSQSRYSWTHSAFSRFVPEPAARGPGGKKYASELSLAGICTVCIGPHMFLDTKFYTVINPPPPPSPLPASTSSTDPNTAIMPTTGEYDHSSPTPPVVLGGSPAPERVIELILARTADMAAEAAAKGTVPESVVPTLMDIDLPSSLIKDHGVGSLQSKLATEAVSKIDEAGGSAKFKVEPIDKGISYTSRQTIPQSSTVKMRVPPPPRPQRPKHQIAFEFKENPGCRWLFPHETSLELTPEEGQEPAKISASFYLPTLEEPYPGMAGHSPGVATGLVPGPGQATTMVILQATNDLWAGLQQAINDPAATYRFMMDKMKHIPPRSYVQYSLPVNFPDEQLLPMGLKKLPDHKVVPLSSLLPSKRTPEMVMNEQQPGLKTKRAKNGQDEAQTVPRGGKRFANVIMATGHSSQPRCSYCDSTSTPQWRRGPDGPSTLCNRCGILWRRGLILQDKPHPLNAQTAVSPQVDTSISTTSSTSTSTSNSPAAPSAAVLTTTADAASRMRKEMLGIADGERNYEQSDHASFNGHLSGTDGVFGNGNQVEGEKTLSGKKRGAKTAPSFDAGGPRLVPIHQIGETAKVPSRPVAGSKKDRTDKEKDKGKDRIKNRDKAQDKDKDKDKMNTAVTVPSPTNQEASSSPLAPSFLLPVGSSIGGSSSSSPGDNMPTTVCPPAMTKQTPESKSSSLKLTSAKVSSAKLTTGAPKAAKQKALSGTTTPATTKLPNPTSAGAKLSLLKAYASTPKYQISHPAAVPTVSLADDGLSFYATKNLYTNNTATFPLHFPTISIAFGPNNAYYMYPNCAMVLFENHFQIKVIHGGERTEIDVKKESIEKTEFQVVDVGDGESMIVMKALLRQHLTRELLNPDRNECWIVFRFRERLDGGGPPVKPLLEQWLKTEVPVATPSATPSLGSTPKS
ncbi:hypothetical protein BGX28_007761 [Mortierella sp. GBA30]|nr:hypothetical protein BGX28_007761 [Mortierella sp. GBA30]